MAELAADAVDELIARTDQGDLFQVVETICQNPDPELAADLFAHLAKRLYAQRKHVSAAVAVGRAGIQYCLCHPVDAATRQKLRERAKSMSFNLGADTWPGWGDEGVESTTSDLDAGLDAARLNLRLVRELGAGQLAESRAHWLIGAQLLARGNDEAALTEFGHARELARAAQDTESELLMCGYAALVDTLHGKSGAQAEFSSLVQRLKEHPGSEDAKFLADQLETALAIFRGRKPKPEPSS